MANTKTLYVGNLPYSVNEAELLQVFAEYGATTARIVEGRGFGFVDIDADKLDQAINDKNDADLGGRTITVNESRPREDRGGGGGGGYRSSSGGGGGGGYGGGRGGGGRSGGGRGGRW